MKQINPYLTFDGDCREAMAFYQMCLGGELKMQTIGSSPLSDKMPKKMKDCILHAELVTENFSLMATDCVPDSGIVKGNSVSLNLNCLSEAETRTLFEKLSVGGTQTHPLEITYWGALFGGLIDKFGNHWLLSFDANLINQKD